MKGECRCQFSKTICVEAVIIPQCKRGLVVFDAITNTRKEIMTFSPGSRIYLTLDFNTDKVGFCNIGGQLVDGFCTISGAFSAIAFLLLSNKAKGFQLTDDGINSDSHGKSMSGYSIAYGRRRDVQNKIVSKSSAVTTTYIETG